MKHPAVAMSAVVGIPDPIRTESIKAWIVLRPGFAASDELAREIQEFVVQLAAHEYPRFVQFAETLPMTATARCCGVSCGRWARSLRSIRRGRYMQKMLLTPRVCTAPRSGSSTIWTRRWSSCITAGVA